MMVHFLFIVWFSFVWGNSCPPHETNCIDTCCSEGSTCCMDAGYCAPPGTTCCLYAPGKVCKHGLECCGEQLCFDPQVQGCCGGHPCALGQCCNDTTAHLVNPMNVASGKTSAQQMLSPFPLSKRAPKERLNFDPFCIAESAQCCGWSDGRHNPVNMSLFACPRNTLCCAYTTGSFENSEIYPDCCKSDEQCCGYHGTNGESQAAAFNRLKETGQIPVHWTLADLRAHRIKRAPVPVPQAHAQQNASSCANVNDEFCCGGLSCPIGTLCCDGALPCCYGFSSTTHKCVKNENGILSCPTSL